MDLRLEHVDERPLETVRRRTAARRNRDFVVRRLLLSADVVGLVAALAIAGPFASEGWARSQLLLGLALLPGWILLFKLYGLYDRDAKRVSHSTIDDLPWLFHALVIGSLGIWLIYRYAPVAQLTAAEGFVFFGAALLTVLVARGCARAVSRFVVQPERVLFVGGGPMARLLAGKLRLHPEYELEPIGYLDASETREDGELPYLGCPSEIHSICLAEAVERVFILSPQVSPDEVADLIRVLHAFDIHIGILPHVIDVLGPSVEIDDVEGITVLGASAPVLTRSSRFVKRFMDLAIVVPLILLFAPVMLVVALAIRLSSPGRVFYTQTRVGRDGRLFRIYKFRTMVEDAEQRGRELKGRSAHPVWLLLEHDPRVTRIGRVLRQLSLDELPQLFNILKGDMSLVGPRPMPPDVDEQIRGWGRRRLDLTPGITGLWQVLGRTNIPFEEMVKLDYLYVTNWSLWQDVRLLIHTLPAVLGRRGAN